MNAKYRYPGVKPFEFSDESLFFGRGKDMEQLKSLVTREQLSVMFGKSGYGKSSLIKAGLFPDLRQNPGFTLDPETGAEQALPNLPIYVRLNLFGKFGKMDMPTAALVKCLRHSVKNEDTQDDLVSFFEKNNIERSLWTAFKSSKTTAEQRIFLIFDQFEEFFSYPVEAQTQFRHELSELLYTRIPQSVRDRMGQAEPHLKRLMHQQMDIHALIVIRSDRIHLLNSMRTELPAILHQRFELGALTEAQARDAIVKPAAIFGDTFLTPPFSYDPAALSKILSELGKHNNADYDQDPQHTIEAFTLQMVCQTIEKNLAAKIRNDASDTSLTVKESDLPDFSQIYEQYYQDRLADLPAGARQTAHVLLEEVLIIGDEFPEIRRVSMDKELLEETMLKDHKMEVSLTLLNYLENNFLIRRENIGGRTHYEISHDVLLEPLVHFREEARRIAAKQKAEIARQEELQKMKEEREREREAEKRANAERIAAEERKRREEAEKQEKKARALAFWAIIATTVAIIFGIYAFTQKNKAEENYRISDYNYKKAQEALVLTKQLEAEKKRLEWNTTLKDIKAILENPRACPSEQQKSILDSLQLNFPDDSKLQTVIQELKNQIQTKNCPQ